MQIPHDYEVFTNEAGLEWTEIKLSRRAAFLRFKNAFIFLQLSYDGVTYGDEITLDGGNPPKYIPFSTLAFRYRTRPPWPPHTPNIVAFY